MPWWTGGGWGSALLSFCAYWGRVLSPEVAWPTALRQSFYSLQIETGQESITESPNSAHGRRRDWQNKGNAVGEQWARRHHSSAPSTPGTGCDMTQGLCMSPSCALHLPHAQSTEQGTVAWQSQGPICKGIIGA